MDLTPDRIDELLAGWALDALEDEERATVEQALQDDPALAVRAEELQTVVSLLGQTVATTPPPEVRSRLLEQVAVTPQRRSDPTDPLTLLTKQIATLDDLLGSLDDTDWHRRAAPYEWSVHGLVAHLLVIERYIASQLGLSEPLYQHGPIEHLDVGGPDIDAELARPAAATHGAWRDAALATVTARRAGEGPPDRAVVEFHGYPFRVENLLIARAFEIWIHADDIRRATGRRLQAPSPTDLRAMSELSVTSLPLVLPTVAPDLEFHGGRIVLTGDGGGTFDLGDNSRRDVLIVADVVDYCRLAARRLTTEELAPLIEGDEDTATHLLAAARVFAV